MVFPLFNIIYIDTPTASKIVCEDAIVVFKEILGIAADIIGIWPALSVLFVLLLTIVFFRKQINKTSLEKIKKLEKEGKYIPGLFIELNESKEYLRYSIFRKKWKKRIIKEYNNIFSDNNGEILKEAFDEIGHRFILPSNASFSEITSYIEKTRKITEELYEKAPSDDNRYKESLLLFHIRSNNYENELSQLQKKLQYSQSNYIVLTGSAGNGKTNLLCSYAELLINLKYPCVFINAKDVKENIADYFIRQLPVFETIKKWSYKPILWLFRARKKPVYLIIDGINENGQQQFFDDYPSFINTFSKYCRIIVACRSEYYEVRYKTILADKISTAPLIENIQEQKYTNAAKQRMHDVYADFFGFKGTITNVVKEQLSQQLLLMRMFYETSRNESGHISSLDRCEIFTKYINQLKNSSGQALDDLLEEIVDYMTEHNSYDCVPESEIFNKSIINSIDGSVLLSKKVIYQEGTVLEKVDNLVYFVFDEMRDYCIAKRNLSKMCNAIGSFPESDVIIQYLENLLFQDAPCLEGVVNYIYHDCRLLNKDDVCASILDKIVKPVDEASHGRGFVQNDGLISWGLKLIFEGNGSLLECEEKYIEQILVESSENIVSAFFKFIIDQELNGGQHTLDVILNILEKYPEKEDVAEILKKCINQWGQGIHCNELIEIDKELSEKSKEAAFRFRQFEVLFVDCFKWQRKQELVQYLKNLDNIGAVIIEVRRRFYEGI